jgi:hypothetical protein
MKRIDEVFRPNFHSERDQEKNYKLHFLNTEYMQGSLDNIISNQSELIMM